eukprot:352195-Chlamydomonas_euryale.AAC.5
MSDTNSPALPCPQPHPTLTLPPPCPRPTPNTISRTLHSCRPCACGSVPLGEHAPCCEERSPTPAPYGHPKPAPAPRPASPPSSHRNVPCNSPRI